MKKITIYIVFTLFTFIQAKSQIITFTDPVFKTKLLSATSSNFVGGNASATAIKIDTNNDGQIQVSEALNVVYLNVPNSNISSLNGIEQFTNIKYLYCNNNLLTQLPISNLTQLRLLNCEHNQLTNLSSIQNLTQITDLDFSFNQVTSVALQNLSNLSFLIAENNLLTELDVCGTSVYRLYCANNPNLTSINLKNNVVTSVPFTFEAGPFPAPPFPTLSLLNLPSLNYICHDVGEYNAISYAVSLNYSLNISYITFSTECTLCTDQSVVNLKVAVQGYSDGNSNTMIPLKFNQGLSSNPNDVSDLLVELRNASGALIASTTTTLKTNGTATCLFPPLNGTYFIGVKTTNSVKVWSSSPQLISIVPTQYDFTTSVTKAYGNNLMALDNGKFAVYSGDINNDGNVDNSDYSAWEMDANNFAFGYLATDLNGDGNVDNSDYSIWEMNSNNFVTTLTPF